MMDGKIRAGIAESFNTKTYTGKTDGLGIELVYCFRCRSTFLHLGDGITLYKHSRSLVISRDVLK